MLRSSFAVIAFRMLAVATVLLAASPCAPASATVPGPVQKRTFTTVRYGSANLKIKVPAAPKPPPSARGIRPLYVSPSTKSFTISTDGGSPVIANVNPSTSYAIATLRHIPVGTHSFTVTAYDRLGGTGTVLSTGNSGPVNVTAGYTNVYLTLSGVVASVALVLDYPNPTLGSPAIINLDVIAKDPDGNVILGLPFYPPQPYTRPFTLTTSDAVNGKLSQTTVQESAGAYGLRVSVTYSGADVSKIVLSATGGGLTPKTVTPATLVPIAPPTVGQQLIAQQLDDPVTSFSTAASHQLLATIGSGNTLYDSIAADETTGRIYMEVQDYPKERIEIFTGGGAYSPIDSIAVPRAQLGGIAVDPARAQLFVSAYDSTSVHTSVFSTAPGHALLGTIPYLRAGIPSLAVDSSAGRLYAAGCTRQFACDSGFEVFSTVAPYKKLGAYGETPFTISYCAVAVDAVTEDLFLSECNLPNENPSYVDVYAAADLNTRIARIGPLTPAAQIAIDSKARVLYVTNIAGETYPYSVNMYAIDDGFSFVGSLPIRSVDHIAVAPYAK